MFKFKIYIENNLSSEVSSILNEINICLTGSESAIVTESECLNLNKSSGNITNDVVFIFFKFDCQAFKHLRLQNFRYYYFIYLKPRMKPTTFKILTFLS
jgi:hypothetical protein